MSRYIDADVMIANALQDSERLYLESVAKHTPSIDLDDYVPKEFHDKTCEAMAKRHQEEIADMESVVRCKECRFGQWHEQAEEYICIAHDQDLFDGDHFCSYGEHKEKCKECWYWSEVHKRCENKCGCQFKPYGERSRR